METKSVKKATAKKTTVAATSKKAAEKVETKPAKAKVEKTEKPKAEKPVVLQFGTDKTGANMIDPNVFIIHKEDGTKKYVIKGKNEKGRRMMRVMSDHQALIAIRLGVKYATTADQKEVLELAKQI